MMCLNYVIFNFFGDSTLKMWDIWVHVIALSADIPYSPDCSTGCLDRFFDAVLQLKIFKWQICVNILEEI